MSRASSQIGGRVAIVGTGSRAEMFLRGIVERPASVLVGICEPNSIRAQYYNDLLMSLGAQAVPVYKPEEFGRMLKEESVDVVVITCVDALHDLYIVPALEAGVRVFTEKPMTTDVAKFNWWIDAEPETVAGFGKLAFYGDEAGKRYGWAREYIRARGSEQAKDDPFAIHLEADPTYKKIYADAEGEDGYYRDQNVFAPGIGIEDDMSVMTAYSPWEGYRVMFNGSNGRLELEVVESQFRIPSTSEGVSHGTQPLPHAGLATVTLQRLWEKPEKLPVVHDHAGHGGGDKRMLNALFGPRPGEAPEVGDASKQSANERDGALALAVGLMANESFKTQKFVDLKSLSLPLEHIQSTT
ncbi:hypothetical protein C0992_007414 [Termitomyces sp. T32_za158]|nr:hypothetical protein C0992_007414 [Termitomyces sp. T32_za158]